MKLNISIIIIIALFGLSIICSCGMDKTKSHKETTIKPDNNVKVVEVNNDKKDESEDNENKPKKGNQFDFEGKWCSYSFDEPEKIEMMLTIKKIDKINYKVKFENIIGLQGYVNFNEIGTFVSKNDGVLLIDIKEPYKNTEGKISYHNIPIAIEMGKDSKGHPEITFYWDYKIPEPIILGIFKRCD